MKYRFSDVYSDKNYLAIIYMCLKMHCLKYSRRKKTRPVFDRALLLNP